VDSGSPRPSLRELLNFRVKISLSGHDTYEAWREQEHDDLVLAVGLAAWLAENGRDGFLLYIKEEAERIQEGAGRVSFFLGVELGQVSVVTAVAVVESLTLPFLRSERIRTNNWVSVQPVYRAPDGSETRNHPPVTFALRHLERIPAGVSYPEIVSEGRIPPRPAQGTRP
jgi:hypothetical protein